MKAKLLTILLAFTTLVVRVDGTTLAPPAAPPEFMSQEQLATWNADQASAIKTAPPSQKNASQFYTGKPYVADAGGYVYEYRTYNPEMSRWTCADPSGFPDGVNNFNYVINPVSQDDSLGLFLSGSGDPHMHYDEDYWDAAQIYAAAGGYTLIQESLAHAEAGTDWNMSSSDAAEIKSSQLYQNTVYSDIQSTLESDITPGETVMDTNPQKYNFTTADYDEYYGLHSLTFSSVGTVTWNNGEWTYTATVTLSKYWSFSNYGSGGTAYSTAARYNAVGYRLQYYGYIAPYTVSGSFTDTWTE